MVRHGNHWSVEACHKTVPPKMNCVHGFGILIFLMIRPEITRISSALWTLDSCVYLGFRKLFRGINVVFIVCSGEELVNISEPLFNIIFMEMLILYAVEAYYRRTYRDRECCNSRRCNCNWTLAVASATQNNQQTFTYTYIEAGYNIIIGFSISLEPNQTGSPRL